MRPLASGAAQAQSAIAGMVKDTSGAVLPGVTVEASSHVLIEKTRSVITDGEGAYRIVDLRPGTYSVTFTLPGFQTFKRDGARTAGELHRDDQRRLNVGALRSRSRCPAPHRSSTCRPTPSRRC